MPLNRELLAAVKLESASDSDWSENGKDHPLNGQPSTSEKNQRAAVVNNDGGDEQAVSVQLLIRCLKIALERSISSISLPQKKRHLNPKKDFSIASTTHYEVRPAVGISCCHADSTNVKKARRMRMREVWRSPPGGIQGAAHPLNHEADPPLFSREATSIFNDDEDDAALRLSLARRVHNRSRDFGGLHGRRTRPSFTRPQTSMDFYSSDEDEDEDDDEDKPPVNFTFTDFSPMCYRHIREFFRVDAKTYCEVLCNSRWHSIPTPGKSGAQLFFCGRNWVIKTMKDHESDFLREILHRYYYHARDNPFTLLPHFVGHHRLCIGGKTHNFVVMQNVFATTNTIHEKYDLKGSTIGRYATDAEKRRATCTQKDLDINRPIHVGHERRTLLLDQIRSDCEFLKLLKIMDYSFLVGVHELQSAEEILPSVTLAGSPGIQGYNRPDGTLRRTSTFALSTAADLPDTTGADLLERDRKLGLDGRCFTSDQGGMLSNTVRGLQQEIYYLGIIDVLQTFNYKKKVEHLVLGVVHDRACISSVSPNDYAMRFIAFVSSIIL